jgi:hypothetical protein
MIRPLIVAAGLVSLFVSSGLANEESLLARVTVYWATGIAKCDRAHFNGARLRAGHCAVDPKKIPYGSRVFFPDGPCVAVDTGPAVIDRKAARLSGRNRCERNAPVVDRFFETKEAAVAWERAHPHFMTLRVVGPRSRSRPVEARAPETMSVAQTIGPLPARETSARSSCAQARPPRLLASREIELTVAATVTLPKRSPVSAPPSYHRRRFATDANDETEVPPPRCTRIPRSRFV